MRTVGIFVALILFSTLALSAYFTFFVDGPEDIVQSFVDSYNGLDFAALAACMDPKYERMYNAFSNITLGFGGIGTSFGDILSFSPLLSSVEGENGEHMPVMTIDNISVEIKGSKIAKFKEMVKTDINNVEKVIGDTANINAIVTLDTGTQKEESQVIFKLKHYSSDGWRIIDIVEVN